MKKPDAQKVEFYAVKEDFNVKSLFILTVITLENSWYWFCGYLKTSVLIRDWCFVCKIFAVYGTDNCSGWD